MPATHAPRNAKNTSVIIAVNAQKPVATVRLFASKWERPKLPLPTFVNKKIVGMSQSEKTKDPGYPQPPFPAQEQNPPGQESEMDPRPDHGEMTYVGRERLKGKRVIITGGDSGIGKAVAIAFAREGADLCISYLSEHDDASITYTGANSAGCPGRPMGDCFPN